MAQVTDPRKNSRHSNGMVRGGQWGAAIISAGRAPRIGLPSIPASPAGPGAAGAPGAGVGCVRSVPGAGEIDAVPSWAVLVRKSAGRLRALRAWRRSAGSGSAAVMVCLPAWTSMVPQRRAVLTNS